MNMSTRIVVIGAGFGGLAAAIRLAARGERVTLVEKLDQPGGRAAVFRQDGFVFDAGPTVITAPWLITELFELAGRRPDDYLTLLPVDPFYRIFFDDGASFDYSGSPERMQDEILRLTGDPAEVRGYERFLAQSRRIFDKGFTELAAKPFLSVRDMAAIAPALVRLNAYRNVYRFVSGYVRNEQLRQVLSFHPLLVGGNPFSAPSIYALIHYLEREWGVWYASGGTGAVVRALTDLFTELGGNLRLNAEVSRICTSGNRVTGVELAGGEEITADIVVSNADVAMTYERLLPGSPRFRSPSRLRHSMSLVVIYFGTDRQYRSQSRSALAHHSVILGPRYRELLGDIFERKVLADDFSLYLHMPTLTDPTLAPEGGEAFYVLAPVPNLEGAIDWEDAAGPYRDRIMRFLEERYLPDLSRHLVTERIVDPRYFRDTLSSHAGAAFSVEPTLTQSAYFRPHNRARSFPNLYFVGAGTHPGAGLPGVLTSAKIADDLIRHA